MSRTYRDLKVWQDARNLAVDVYRCTENFPKTETFGLQIQLRRAAVSVASNIAEGQGRNTRGEFIQFLGHARGSLLEIETQLSIAHELGYLDKTTYELLDQKSYAVLGLLIRLIQSMQQPKSKS